MDIDPVKAVALISGILAILDKLYVYGKATYEKKSSITGGEPSETHSIERVFSFTPLPSKTSASTQAYTYSVSGSRCCGRAPCKGLR